MTGARTPTAVIAVLLVVAPLAAAQTAWVEHASLVAEDPEEGSRFGAAVAFDGVTAAVGAPARPDPGSAAGAVHLFERSDGGFAARPMLRPADIRSGDRFGSALALDGDTLVVGAPDEDDPGRDSGAAFVYVRSGGSWSRQAKLAPADLEEGDRFGHAVAVDDDLAIVTAPTKDATAELAGVAYVFTRSGGSWSQEASFQPDDVAEADVFGNGVDLDGDTALVSATGDDDPRQSGAAYLFARAGGSWSQRVKMTADDPRVGEALGSAVVLEGSTAVLGAPGRPEAGHQSGAAFVFATGDGAQQAKLNLSDAEGGDRAGEAVAVAGSWALVGAPGADGGASDAGRVAAFGPPGAGGGDGDGDGADGDGPVTPAVGVLSVVAGVGAALLVRRR